MPSASGKIELDGTTNQGLGYVERLTTTLKPWQMPINILRWGRFLSNNHSIVWIRWEGEEEKFLIFHNGLKYVGGIIDDDRIEFGTYRLMLEDKFTLRNGPLVKTVFDKFSTIKQLFPAGFLNMKECKWQTRSELFENTRCISKGWSIHENVQFQPKLPVLGKIFYGSLFTIVIPLLLSIWAKQTEHYIHLPILTNPFVGTTFICLGFVLMITAMSDLWFKGHGLPMNAYPPPKLVTNGVYKLFSHPIYIGSSLTCFGLSITCQSKSGFWLVSPILTLAWLALVHGYENEDLQKRFPDVVWKRLVDLPENVNMKSQFNDIVSAYCLVLIPWLVLYQLVIFVGPSANCISTYLQFESNIPVIEWTEFFYLLAYPFVALVPLVLQTKQQIRSFIIDGLLNISIGIYLQFILPFVAVPKAFVPQTFLGEILLHERDLDGPTGAFPSFHVSWAFLCAHHYTRAFPKHRSAFYILSALISASCVTTGMHSIIDVIAGYLLFLICIKRQQIWQYLRRYFENLANSWAAYRIGPLRIINNSLYVFLSAASGAYLVCSLPGNNYAMLFVSISSLFGGAVCGQLLESSSGLSRPFGYFGFVTGGLVGSIAASWLFHIPILSFLSASALANPWIQATGRLRCVAQGCCHGRRTNPFLGILVTNPHSRVCSLSQLHNKHIHITPAYSILANALIGMLLWRLWYSEVSLCLIISLYFILIGLSRFVEERFRGEVQTMICRRLKIYQWGSIAFVCIGICFSMLPFNDKVSLHLNGKYEYVIPSIIFGCITASAMGVDFPESTKRFSRLAD
ncbi:unnamed protein product [Adineta ricciae]|nr:unnamed protein product [Adineta ricciae]